MRLEQRHLPDDTLDRAAYDVGISNSVLHHLADPAALWNTLSRTTVDGAQILVMDLCRPADDATVDAIVEQYLPDAPAVLARDFRASLRAAYRVDEVRRQVAAAGLALDVEVITDRHLVVSGAA